METKIQSEAICGGHHKENLLRPVAEDEMIPTRLVFFKASFGRHT